MDGRGELRWLVGTAIVVAVLLGISALALDRPNVRWLRAKAHCPACRTEVEPYSNKCTSCGTDFDWVIAPDDASPVSRYGLSPYEEEALRDRVAALGRPVAIARIGRALQIEDKQAEAWLEAIGRGHCSLCGGTGRNLTVDVREQECPLCFGVGACIASGEDRRIRIGDYEAELALVDFEAALAEIDPSLPRPIRRRELRRYTRDFLRSHAGTVQVGRIPWWRDVVERPGAENPKLAVDFGRETLDRVLGSLALDAE